MHLLAVETWKKLEHKSVSNSRMRKSKKGSFLETVSERGCKNLIRAFAINYYAFNSLILIGKLTNQLLQLFCTT